MKEIGKMYHSLESYGRRGLQPSVSYFEGKTLGPHSRAKTGLTAGLWEVRSNIKSGIARVFFYIDKSEMILLHGLVKNTQKTPDRDLKLAQKRKKEYEKNG